MNALRSCSCLLILLGVAGCPNEEPYEGAFDMPTAVAVLHPETGGPFTEPIGFVASGHGGQIPILALKQGRFLTDDPTASWLRTSHLPTGANRVLSSIAAWAPADDQIGVWVGDRAYERLLYVPYVVGLEDNGTPREGWECDDAIWACEPGTVFEGPRRSEATCTNGGAPCAERSGPELANVELKTGYTSTEVWTLTWLDGEGAWEVVGSRSGRQADLAVTGRRFVAARRAVAFTVQRPGQPGDVISLITDSGVREYDLGGVPQHLSMAPDQALLAAVVHDRVRDVPVLRWFDPVTRTVNRQVALPDDARPGRMAWADGEPTLFVADMGRPAVWEVAQPSGSSASGPIEHVLPWPVLDVAPLFSEAWGRLLYVVPLEANDVWILDLDTGELRDINPVAPGVQGMHLESPIQGIEAMPLDHLWRRVSDDGVRESGRSVAIATHTGRVVFMEEGTGCLVDDELGPRTEVSGDLGGSGDLITNFDDGSIGPYLQPNAQNTRHVSVNPCAGIARRESWSLTFDSNAAAWVVAGTVAGEQEQLAYEDERYVSDNGEVSFMVVAGAAPTQNGWRFQFNVLEGAAQANGDNDRDGTPEISLEVPGDPVFFHYPVGPDRFGRPQQQGDAGPAWKKVDRRAFVLVPSQAANLVGRVNPQEAAVEVSWD